MVKPTFQLFDLHFSYPLILPLRHSIPEYNDVIKRLRPTVELIVVIRCSLDEKKNFRQK